MLNIGDKLMVTKKVANFLNEGDIVKVTDVSDNDIISFAFGDRFMHMGVMNAAECESHFEKFVEEEVPTITQEYIDEIMNNSSFDIKKVFDKCTVVACQLPNGFVVVESSACVNPEDYSEKMGIDVCMKKISNKIWELEAYRLQQWLWEESMDECCCEDCEECCCDCEECSDECLYSDLDCDDCEDYECEFNPNR